MKTYHYIIIYYQNVYNNVSGFERTKETIDFTIMCIHFFPAKHFLGHYYSIYYILQLSHVTI